MKLLRCILILLLAALLFVSCASAESDRPLITEGHVSPEWYEEPAKKNTKTTTAFAGKGVGATKRQAELLSYSDICSKISAFTGSELGEIDYRELSTNGTIEEYGLTIKTSFTTFNGSTYAYYVLVSCSNEELTAHRSAEVVEYYNRIERITDSISAGDRCMMDGNFVGAIKNYINSLCLSYGFDGVEEEYSFNSIFAEVKSLLEIIYFAPNDRITLLKNMTRGYSMVLKIKEGIIPTAVPEGEVKVSYSLTDVRGNLYLEQYVMYTDSNGRFSFAPEDFGVSSGSNITFSLNLDQALAKLRKVNKEASDTLSKLVNDMAYTVQYGKSYTMGPLLIAGLDYWLNGLFLDNSVSTEYFKTQFESNNAVVSVFYSMSEMTDEQILEKCKKEYADCDCLLIVRTGITGIIPSVTDQFIAFAEGRAVLYKVDNSAVVFETDIVNGSGMGQSEEKAGQQAFLMVSEILYNLIRTEYV